MARTIESPGVEINEIDLSNITQLTVGTNILINGFASQGPTQELVNITSVQEFEKVYGYPSNAAERYAYMSARQVLASPGNLIFNRLPYGSDGGEGTGNDYTALVFPTVTIPTIAATWSAGTSASYITPYADSNSFQGVIFGAPSLVKLSAASFEALKQGDITSASGTTSTWLTGFDSTTSLTISTSADLVKGSLIVTNDLKTSIEKDYSGYYIALTDNTNLKDTSYTKVKKIQTRLNGGWYELPDSSYTFNLTSTGSIFSTSEIIETGLGFNFDQPSFDDMVQLTTLRLRPNWLDSTGGATRAVLDQVFIGTVPGSLDISRMGTELTPYNPQPGSVFLDTTVSRFGTDFITAKTNPLIAANFGGKIARAFVPSLTSIDALSAVGFDFANLSSTARATIVSAVTGLGTTEALFALGEYEPCTDTQYKIIGNTVQKLERGFRLAENRDLINLDIVIDAGLSTVESVSKLIADGDAGVEYGNKDIFEDTVFVDLTTLKNANQVTAATDKSYASWQSVFNTFNTFVKETRKDCMFIMDPLRHIFVQGKDTKVINGLTASFSQDILVPMRNLVNNTNSNYAAIYGNWVKTYDVNSDSFFWSPFSGFQAAIMARLDSSGQPWFAPAGLNNGLITNIIDIAVTPNQKERDQFYRYGINPITQFPRDGFVVFGQKTLQAKPSAFDRINVRRMFLVLEKATRQVARYFVFEPNTIFTRTRLVNILKPIFENAKNNQGLYDYLIVCDERNNNPDVIDRNELVVDIYIKPVRSAEFILINFIATRTGDNFSELVGV